MLGWDEMRGMIDLYRADFGVRFDPMAERLTFMTASGRVLDGDTALHTLVDLWCRSDRTAKPIAVPLTASQVVEDIAGKTGHQVLRPGRTRRSLSVLAQEEVIGFAGSTRGGYIFPRFLAAYDGVICVAMVASMLACGSVGLDEIVEGLPAFHKGQTSVFCPAHRKGAVMRAVSETSSGADGRSDRRRPDRRGGWMGARTASLQRARGDGLGRGGGRDVVDPDHGSVGRGGEGGHWFGIAPPIHGRTTYNPAAHLL
jgi:phosphomannomutase